jgi:hypothetical protein
MAAKIHAVLLPFLFLEILGSQRLKELTVAILTILQTLRWEISLKGGLWGH